MLSSRLEDWESNSEGSCMELTGQGGSAGRARIGVLGWRSVELKAGGSEELLRGQSHGADRTGGVCRQSENWGIRLEEC